MNKSLVNAVVSRVRGAKLSREEAAELIAAIRVCCPEEKLAVAVTDPGAHYRGPNVFGLPIDPYRILEAYPNVSREAARHIVKKTLRMGRKGIGEHQLIAELRCCLDRWEQMLREEAANDQVAALKSEMQRRECARCGDQVPRQLSNEVLSAELLPDPPPVAVDPPTTGLACPVCGCACGSNKDLQRHLATAHPEDVAEDVDADEANARWKTELGATIAAPDTGDNPVYCLNEQHTTKTSKWKRRACAVKKAAARPGKPKTHKPKRTRNTRKK